MSNEINQQLEAIHSAVKDIPSRVDELHEKVDCLAKNVTQLQIDSGIAKDNIKSHQKTHSIVSTIIILCITSAIGFAWVVIQKWAQATSEITAISKDLESIKVEQDKIGDRFGHRKGAVRLAQPPSPDID